METHKVETRPGFVFDVSVAGDPGAPLVLLLHGFAVSRHLYDAQVPALGVAGRLEGEHVWVSPTWIAAASGLGGDAGWLEEFGRMVSFAGKHGWVNDAGEIRAHIERE
jgi:hypothetical protein